MKWVPQQDKLSLQITKRFIVLSVFVIAITAALYIPLNAHVRKEVTVKLKTKRDTLVTRLETYIRERKRDVSALAQMPGIVRALKDLIVVYDTAGVNSEPYREADGAVRPYLSAFQKSAGYYDLFLISPEGDLIFSIIHEPDFATNLTTGPYKNTGLADVFRSVKMNTEPQVSRFAYYAPSKKPAAFVAAPVFEAGRLAGVVALQLKPSTLLDTIWDHRGLGQSGEVLALAAMDDQITFVNNTRHDRQAAFQRRVAPPVEGFSPMHEAVRGTIGTGAFKDYRNRPVIAAWGPVPSLHWGLVVKMDRSEAFAPLSVLGLLLSAMLLLLLLGVVIVARHLTDQVSRPINLLTQIVSVMGHGNFHIHVDPRLKELRNEIGVLARVFDTTLKNLDRVTTSRNELDQLTKELTAQKEQLQRASQEVEAMNKRLNMSEKLASVGHLSGGIAHEINNPLTTVLDNLHAMDEYFQSITEVLRRYDAISAESPPEQQQADYRAAREEFHIDHIEQDLPKLLQQTEISGRRIREIVKGLLTFARGDEGRMENVQLDDVIESIWALVAGDIPETIHVEKNYEPKMPPVHANKHLLGQVFVNILLNAIQSFEGKPGMITIRTYSLGANVLAVIQDNGQGIPEESLSHIWNPFFSGKPEGRGTGLGLSIAHSIVEQHNGEISAVSKVGEGTTITISLPPSSS